MPRLSLFQLLKIFAAGFLGYALFVLILSVGTATLFPGFVKGWLDRSIHTFYQDVITYFGFFGIVAAVLMLIGAWCVLRLTGRKG
jgi:hypothetical protein